MRRARSFCPAHITGFFTIKDASENPLQAGSLGAGFCIDRGTFTAVRRRRFRSESAVRINGRRVSAPVSLKTAELFFAAAEISPEPLEIKHRVKVPQGAGFGTSGAGALSLALALNRLYGSPLNEDQTAGVAHTADVLCRTGLGTVVGEQRGGFELRLFMLYLHFSDRFQRCAHFQTHSFANESIAPQANDCCAFKTTRLRSDF